MFAKLTKIDGTAIILNTDHIVMCSYANESATEVTVQLTPGNANEHIVVKGTLEDIRNELNGAQFQQRY